MQMWCLAVSMPVAETHSCRSNCGGRGISIRVGLFYLRVSLVYLRLVFVAYGQLAWSSLLTVEIRFGLFAYGRNRFGLFYLRSSPWPEIRFGLTVPRLRKLGLVFFAYGSPTVSKKDEP